MIAEGPAEIVAVRVKSLRLARGLTARELAQAAGLSLNTISLIERGRMSPTVATLHKLARALGAPLAFLVAEEEAQQVVVGRRGQRQTARSGNLWLESLGSGLDGQTIEPMLVLLEPEASSGAERMSHVGHELVFCLEGKVEYEIGEQVYCLEAEDSLLFSARHPHRWRNPSAVPARLLLIMQRQELSVPS